MMLELPSKRQIKMIRALAQLKNYRKRHGLFLVEGLRATEEALNSDYLVEFLVVSDDFLERHREKIKEYENIKVYEVPRKVYDTLSDTEAPQGIMAVVRMKNHELTSIYEDNFLIVALDGIKDPGNIGTIIRTADAAGASGILAGKGCVDIYNPKVVRSTMGSIFHLPVIEGVDLPVVLHELSQKRAKIVVTHLGAEKSYFDADLTGPVVLVFGSEAEGVSPEILKISTEVVKIPMPGKAESLNVAVAGGIVLFEAVRQRNHPFPL
ncbi:TrmH family RNA methyltransferase [Thermosediminibacter oceani]|uniref:RNA methyltransferase, TrmH family, group 3 n=1 Tax=Thermosediminibacter oceani (strain ATCC BAA-1034 / DSM 16646 / JW/IW-1228P) TaxID=555079 RepID=D9RXS9_THEOJ|nr:RNA methyltransferase [Thermosediminibacter oceani]ADL08153.1 RNA methyltransferase, TrmH family, group 3 [Thermosediminibacter oceani DSM 16646]